MLRNPNTAQKAPIIVAPSFGQTMYRYAFFGAWAGSPALLARTSEPAGPQRVVDDGVTSCPRAGWGKSASIGRKTNATNNMTLCTLFIALPAAVLSGIWPVEHQTHKSTLRAVLVCELRLRQSLQRLTTSESLARPWSPFSLQSREINQAILAQWF